MASSAAASLFAGLEPGVPCGSVLSFLPLAAAGPWGVPHVSSFGGWGGVGLPHPVRRRCSERLTEWAFRVRGSASFGSVSRAATPVIALVHPVARWFRPSLSTILWRLCQPPHCQFPHFPDRASHPHGTKGVSSGADLSQLDVLRPATCNMAASA